MTSSIRHTTGVFCSARQQTLWYISSSSATESPKPTSQWKHWSNGKQNMQKQGWEFLEPLEWNQSQTQTAAILSAWRIVLSLRQKCMYLETLTGFYTWINILISVSVPHLWDRIVLSLHQKCMYLETLTGLYTLFQHPLHLCVTAVAHNGSWPFCQKCRWQNTAKYTCTVCMWLGMKWHCLLVHGCWLYGVHRTCAEMAAVSCDTGHPTTR